MIRLAALFTVVLALVGCADYASHQDPDTAAVQQPPNPNSGLRVSGYARFGMVKLY